MRCILHIGTEKTGTTSLQGALSSHRESLSHQGILYAKAPGPYNSRGLAAAFATSRDKDDYLIERELLDSHKFELWKSQLLASIDDEISEAESSHEVYLLSSEHLSSRVLSDTDVCALAQFFKSKFSDIQVVCYLRRQDQMATSRTNEILRAGFSDGLYPAVNSDGPLPILYDYDALINRWAKGFGDIAIRIRVFDRSALTGGDIVTDFSSSQLGIPSLPVEEDHPNISLSSTAQLALAMFNQAMGRQARRQVTQHRRELSRYLESEAPGSGGKPARHQAEAFYRHFRDGNRQLARRYLQRDSLFDENFSDYPDTAPPADIEAAATLLSRFYAERYAGAQ